MEDGTTERDAHQYWKMSITSIHQGKGRVWVVGFWFYSPTDLEGLLLREKWVI